MQEKKNLCLPVLNNIFICSYIMVLPNMFFHCLSRNSEENFQIIFTGVCILRTLIIMKNCSKPMHLTDLGRSITLPYKMNRLH